MRLSVPLPRLSVPLVGLSVPLVQTAGAAAPTSAYHEVDALEAIVSGQYTYPLQVGVLSTHEYPASGRCVGYSRVPSSTVGFRSDAPPSAHLRRGTHNPARANKHTNTRPTTHTNKQTIAHATKRTNTHKKNETTPTVSRHVGPRVPREYPVSTPQWAAAADGRGREYPVSTPGVPHAYPVSTP